MSELGEFELNRIYNMDCLEGLKKIPDNSVDSIVTDPPAGISFMGKGWDSNKGGRDDWIKWMTLVAIECKRVLKHGGHAFVWAIPRTSHWTTTAWENGGFEPRDVVAHVFGSGFPKSHNIGKSVSKLIGEEREVVGNYQHPDGNKRNCKLGQNENCYGKYGAIDFEHPLDKGTSEWEGWGSALKPAREDWILLRKPLEKGLSIAENCLKWGTGGINIDESRVETSDTDPNHRKIANKTTLGTTFGSKDEILSASTGDSQLGSLGRFPANLIHDNSPEVRECFPESKSIASKRGGNVNSGTERYQWNKGQTENFSKDNAYECGFNDSGNASRFFKSIIYTAKAKKSERNKGCEELEDSIGGSMAGTQDQTLLTGSGNIRNNITKNNHPTVKPIALMEYLIKMITPKGGVVLDPFIGSGTTALACKKNGFKYIGIEKEEEYCKIANKRLAQDTLLNVTKKQNKLFKKTEKKNE